MKLRFRLRWLLVTVGCSAALFAWVAHLRHSALRQRAAIHAARMLHASVSERTLEPTLPRRIWSMLAGTNGVSRTSLAFENLRPDAKVWGPYGDNGVAVELHDWNPDNIRSLKEICREIPGLEVLSFRDSFLPAGMLAEILMDSKRLDYLSLEGTDVSVLDFQALSRVPNLGRLSLASTQVGDDDLDPMVMMTGLKFLSLHNTRVTSRGIKRLAHLRQLEKVDLGLTRIREDVLPVLIAWQVKTQLLVPAEWSEAAVRSLKRQSPSSCEVRKTAYEFRHRPSAIAADLPP